MCLAAESICINLIYLYDSREMEWTPPLQITTPQQDYIACLRFPFLLKETTLLRIVPALASLSLPRHCINYQFLDSLVLSLSYHALPVVA